MSSINTHLRRKQYGPFSLTDAIRPGAGLTIIPEEGFRRGIYSDQYTGRTMPMLSASVSSEKVFDVFLDLMNALGESVHVILESSHDGSVDCVKSCRRTDIDTPVLASYCCEYEDLILNDGCTAVSVLANGRKLEVQFDEHKLFHVYGKKLRPFREILRSYGVHERPDLRLICEDEHLHHSTCRFSDEFQELTLCMGAEEPAPVLSDDHGW